MESYTTDNINFHIYLREDGVYQLMTAPKNGYIVAPPISKEQLKGLADFIYKITNEQ